MKRTSVALLAAGLAGLTLTAAPADEPKPLKPTNLALNTKADEDEPFLSSDALTLYYAANAKDGKFDIMFSHRRSRTQGWPAGQILQDYIQTPADDRGVFATTEGRFPQFLYYATRKDKEANNFDIFVAIKMDRGKAFAEPTPLNKIDTDADEMHPWLSSDGKQFYFSRKTKEGWRVFVATRPAARGPQGFGEPAMIEELPPNFCHATLSPDGKIMFLQGPLEKDRLGLFRSTCTKEGWSKPEPLELLNSPEAPTGDRSPALSRDGGLLYFASDRPGGKGGLDLWVIPTTLLPTRK
jgi:hypothetical protein